MSTVIRISDTRRFFIARRRFTRQNWHRHRGQEE